MHGSKIQIPLTTAKVINICLLTLPSHYPFQTFAPPVTRYFTPCIGVQELTISNCIPCHVECIPSTAAEVADFCHFNILRQNAQSVEKLYEKVCQKLFYLQFYGKRPQYVETLLKKVARKIASLCNHGKTM